MNELLTYAAILALAGTGLAGTGLAGTGLAGTGLAGTGSATVPPAADARSPAPSGYVAPLGVLELVRGFQRPAERWGAGHRGVDLAAAVGQPVEAPGPGIVTFAGTVAGRGVVTITHDDGLRSSLEPVDASVMVGEEIGAGDEVGEVESARGHCAPSACVHWGVRDGETYLDPLRLLGRGPSVLLPGP